MLLGSVMAGAVAYTGCAGQITVRDVDKERVEMLLEKEKVTVIFTKSSCAWVEEAKKVEHLAGLDAGLQISTRYIDENCDGHIDRISKHVYKIEKSGLAKPIDNWMIERSDLERVIKSAPAYDSEAQFFGAVNSGQAKEGVMSTTVELYLELKRWDSKAAELMKKYELQKVKEYFLKKK